jgi:DNA-directed RNA polymerase subunit RPC12/RpoP
LETEISSGKSDLEIEKSSESLAYPLSYKKSNKGAVLTDRTTNQRMVLKCKSCGSEFDSTFSVEEFSLLSKEQYEAGTLHLCPHCGNLSIYELKDYHDPTG